MVLAYHLVFSAYGFWLPNDPRGSGSSIVLSEALREYGPATKVTTRHSVASKPHDIALRLEAKTALQYPPVLFNDEQCRAIGRGFGEFVKRSGVIVWACAIMADHVHLVIARHRYKVEQMANLMKGAATSALLFEGLHPFQEYRDKRGKVPHCWGGGEYKVFLNTVEEILQRIRYVEDNPVKEGRLRQMWEFVTPFDPERFCGGG
jgi:REP element-mobilizing transposase RayT